MLTWLADPRYRFLDSCKALLYWKKQVSMSTEPPELRIYMVFCVAWFLKKSVLVNFMDCGCMEPSRLMTEPR